jgi:hypothetical protein
MIETVWTILPFPYNELAQPLPLRALETPCLLDALIATGAALAGGGRCSGLGSRPGGHPRDAAPVGRASAQHRSALARMARA